jgi:hypothetical protein
MLGRETRIPYEVTEHDPPRRSSFRTLSGPIHFVGAATFVPDAGGTRMTFTVDLVASGPARLVARVLARRVARDVPGHLGRFNALAEDAQGATART